MARLVDLRKLRTTYSAVLSNGEAAWLQTQTGDTPRRKSVAEDIFLRFVIGWETFVSDWFIGCINHDASRLKRTLERKMADWLNRQIDDSPYKALTANFPKPTLPLRKHAPVSRVRELLDPRERNIEFRSMSALSDRAHRELAPRYASRVQAALDAGAGEIVDGAVAIRNALAHRSANAVRLMNERLSDFQTYPELRKKCLSSAGIGTYLNARTQSGEARLLVFRRELDRLANLLAP